MTTSHTTTTITSQIPARDDAARASTAPSPPMGLQGRRGSRSWALAGFGAAVAGLTSVMISSTAGGVYDLEVRGDAEKVRDAVNADHAVLIAFHVLAVVAALLLIPFGLGLARRLRSALPAESLLPGVAASGVLLTAGVLVLGSGLDTEFIVGGHEPGDAVAENVAMYNHWIGTIPWLWVGVGLSGLAVWVAALRHQAVPRWLGPVGLLLGGLTVLLGISPLQYMAGMTGPLWMAVTALGFVLGDRAHRR